MKSYSVFFITLFSLLCVSLNAQVFVGGNFSFSTSSNKTNDGGTTILKSSSYNFGLSPNVGKFLSEKMAVGLSLDISFIRNSTGVNPETVNKSTSIGGSPFLRYYAIKWNKFSLFGQGNIGLSFSGSSTKTGGVTSNGPKNTSVYLSIYPGLSYDINDKFSLQTSLNFLSLGYNYTTSKIGTYKSKSSGFNVGAGLDNIVTVGTITIGAIYKF
jgi:outer membrane protein